MTFSAIYRGNLWNGKESLSGPGSGSVPTRRVVPELLALVAELGIESVLDVGCGDSFWLPDLPGYIGVDVAPEAVERARGFHPERRYEVIDGPLPKADLAIVRDVLQHLSPAEGKALLDSIPAKWLLASTYIGGQLVDFETSEHAWSPDLSSPPFDLGKPEQLIFDGYDWTQPDFVRDPAKFLGLWRL